MASPIRLNRPYILWFTELGNRELRILPKMNEVVVLYGGRPGKSSPSPAGKGQSGFKNTTASGGSVNETEYEQPCQGTGLASTPPRLPTLLPP